MNFLDKIDGINNPDFESIALEVFRYQAENCSVYRTFLQYLNVGSKEIKNIDKIPFLPISLFKTHLIQTGQWSPAMSFRSSGTTEGTQSTHLVRKPAQYLHAAESGFGDFYGNLEDWAFLCLLPAYLEREGSSLVYMAEHFVKKSKHQDLSGFFLFDYEKLVEKITACKERKIKTLLLGVSFALLDLGEKYRPDLNGITVMETGGMKGRRREMIREELHAELCKLFNINEIHSEYGMTELFSQAYSKGNGIFHPSKLMRVSVRDPYDPFCNMPFGKSGCLNIIDLANFYTCSFIATDDVGKCYEDHSFEILGRFDNSDIRGCNLLVG